MGLNMTTAFNIYLKAIVRQGKIPFEIKSDLFYSENNLRRLEKSIDSIKQGKYISKTIEELKALEDE